MAFDNRTNTITVGPNFDFVADSGVFFINTLKKLAENSNPPTSIANDWKVTESWLQCAGRPLSDQDNDKIAKAWRAYIAIGVAPSEELQPMFTDFSNRYQRDGLVYVQDKPPTKVMDVFDRLLATEAAITTKRKQDWDNERKRFEAVLGKVAPRKESSWWRSKSKNFRVWAFGSGVWAFLVLVFFAVFDPHNYGTWKYMRNSDYIEMFCIMAIPLLAGGINFIYEKFVK